MTRTLLILDAFWNCLLKCTWSFFPCPTVEGFTQPRTVPTSGYRNPAPTLARMSRIGRIKPVGAPFCSGSWDNDKWVLAMQIGRFPNPWERQWKKTERKRREINEKSVTFPVHKSNCSIWPSSADNRHFIRTFYSLTTASHTACQICQPLCIPIPSLSNSLPALC